MLCWAPNPFEAQPASMSILGKSLLPILILFPLACALHAQTAPTAPCSIDPPSFATSAPNIFNDRQEQDLGDALAEYFESDMRIAPPVADDQLTRIGDRLLATLPPTGIHYRFRIYDSGDINGFSIGGGRVYISRKLIAAVKTEDELAGVLAHEIGHLSTHQTAIETTRSFRLRLGVTQVGDRADIFAKVHQFMSTPSKKNEEEDKEEKDQLVADHVALYAMLRAGYVPESFASFLDRITLNKGKTGNWFSDALGINSESTQRYRTALKLIAALPPDCKGKHPASGDAFATWLRAIVDERVQSAAANADGDQPLKLDPPLRPSLWRIRFSPDGRYVLAQDEGSITVMDKDGAKPLFRIDAPDAYAAQFTPDSSSVVFHDPKLRVERWSVPAGKRTAVNELVVYDGCHQSLLSQDGKTLVCTHFGVHDGAPRISLHIVDVDTGKFLLDKPNFYESPPYLDNNLQFLLEGMMGGDFVEMLPSPGGKYVLILFAHAVLAWDFEAGHQIEVGRNIKDLTRPRATFLGPDKIFVVGEPKGTLFQAQVLSFPDGRVLKDTQMGVGSLQGATKPDTLIVTPLKDYAVGLFDPMQGKILAASKLPAIDESDQLVAVEDPTGGVQIGQPSQPGFKRIPLPIGPLPFPRSAAFSRDGKYLAVSMRSRGEIWDLETGKQVALTHPFRSIWFDPDDHIYAEFPKYINTEAKAMKIEFNPTSGKDLSKYEEDDLQFKNLQVRFRPIGKEKATDRHATLEVKNMETQAVAWTRDYPHEMPAVWRAEDDRMVLSWDLNTDQAKAEIKSNPALQKQMETYGNHKKGLLIETVVPETGAPLQQVLIPEADLSGGWHDSRRATVSGDFVLAHGEHDNTVIDRLDNGLKLGEFFGSTLATDAATGIVAAINRGDEILLIDEHTARELSRFTLGSPVMVAHIVSGKSKLLLVLTADQVVHRIPLPN